MTLDLDLSVFFLFIVNVTVVVTATRGAADSNSNSNSDDKQNPMCCVLLIAFAWKKLIREGSDDDIDIVSSSIFHFVNFSCAIANSAFEDQDDG